MLEISICVDRTIIKMRNTVRLARMIEGECSEAGIHSVKTNDYRTFLEGFKYVPARFEGRIDGQTSSS